MALHIHAKKICLYKRRISDYQRTFRSRLGTCNDIVRFRLSCLSVLNSTHPSGRKISVVLIMDPYGVWIISGCDTWNRAYIRYLEFQLVWWDLRDVMYRHERCRL